VLDFDGDPDHDPDKSFFSEILYSIIAISIHSQE